MILKFIYTLFIGVILATLVGVGIAAFYEGPKMPDYPSSLKVPQAPERAGETTSPEQLKKQEEYDAVFKVYQDQLNIYNRNVSIIALVISVAVLVVSLTLFKKLLVIADGLLLGGVLTLIYSVIRGFGSDDTKFRFVVVASCFLIALILGYIKFIRIEKKIS